MLVKMNSEQILYFAFMPVGRVDFSNNARNSCGLDRQRKRNLYPTRSGNKKQVVQLPAVGLLLRNDAAEHAAPVPEQEATNNRQ
jgi:hypothetical protein